MARYEFHTLGGRLSSPLVLTVADKLGLIDYPPNAIVEALMTMWADHYDRFAGLIANLLFDLGYVGTMLFVLFYAWLVNALSPPRRKPLSFASLMVLGPIFVLPALGFTSSMLKSLGYNLLILYSALFYLYLARGRKRLMTVPEGRRSDGDRPV